MLGYNQFQGEIPSCIGALTNLELLFLSNNLLTGSLPDNSTGLSNLQMVWLDDNALSGNVASAFDGMPFLQGLFLEDNYFQGYVSDTFLAQNRLLIELDLSGNELTGYVPRHFFSSTTVPLLRVVDLHGNRLSVSLALMD